MIFIHVSVLDPTRMQSVRDPAVCLPTQCTGTSARKRFSPTGSGERNGSMPALFRDWPDHRSAVRLTVHYDGSTRTFATS